MKQDWSLDDGFRPFGNGNGRIETRLDIPGTGLAVCGRNRPCIQEIGFENYRLFSFQILVEIYR